jgi:hypothetical protein
MAAQPVAHLFPLLLELTIPWVPHPLRPTRTYVQTGLIADAKGGIPHRSPHHIVSCHDDRFRIHARDKCQGTASAVP